MFPQTPSAISRCIRLRVKHTLRDDIQLSVTMEWGEIFWLLSLSELRKVGGWEGARRKSKY
jgi:hypothetical protein